MAQPRTDTRRSPLRALATATAAAAGLLLGACAHQAATPASMQAHLDAAKQAAGSDLGAFLNLCKPASPTRPVITDEALLKMMAAPAVAPAKAFDNLYYVGSGWVSAWALKTSDGLLLIDAMNTNEEVDRLVLAGLRQLGQDPAQIRTVLVTHGHGDHYGGAQYLRQLGGAQPPRLVMSALDWDMTATQLEFASPVWPAPPKRDAARDVSAQDAQVLRQGDTAVTMFITPGHTLGTISPVFDVTWNGQKHRAMIWGGTSFNFGRDLDRLDAYIASTERMKRVAREQNVDVLLSNHPGTDGSAKNLAALRGTGAGGANPYIVGVDTVQRAMTVAGECARANRDRFEMNP